MPPPGQAVTPRQLLWTAKAALWAWVGDGAASMGAALAFYTVLSMAPLLLIVITIAGFFFGEDAARGALFAQIAGMVGANAIQAVLASTANSGSGSMSIVVASSPCWSARRPYRPSSRPRRDVWVGVAMTSLRFSVSKFLISRYIGKASILSSFGASGTLIAIIVWVYYSAQIFLLGAEFTCQFARRHGSLAAKPESESKR